MSMLPIGIMDKLGDALVAAGYTLEEVTKLRSSGPLLRQFRGVLRGVAKIVVIRHIINLDADPFVPNGWQIVAHIKGGQLEWDLTKIALYLSGGQQNGKKIIGDKLREELTAYNANLLDYLFAHPELIPEDWKGKSVFFWGTIYRNSNGLCIRYLHWDDRKWCWRFGWLDVAFDGSHPAAVPAST